MASFFVKAKTAREAQKYANIGNSTKLSHGKFVTIHPLREMRATR
jgi:hypothetical protein